MTAGLATGPARQAPPGAMPNRGLARKGLPHAFGRQRPPQGRFSPEARVGSLTVAATRTAEEWSSNPGSRSGGDRIRLTGHPRRHLPPSTEHPRRQSVFLALRFKTHLEKPRILSQAAARANLRPPVLTHEYRRSFPPAARSAAECPPPSAKMQPRPLPMCRP